MTDESTVRDITKPVGWIVAIIIAAVVAYIWWSPGHLDEPEEHPVPDTTAGP